MRPSTYNRIERKITLLELEEEDLLVRGFLQAAADLRVEIDELLTELFLAEDEEN